MRALNDTPIVSIGEVATEVVAYHAKAGQMLGITSGIPRTDDLWRLERGTLTVLTGIPGAGKSEIMDQVICKTVNEDGWRWLVLSPENMPVESHAAKIIEKSLAMPFGPFHGHRMSADDAYCECKRLAGHIRMIEPNDKDQVDLDWIMQQLDRAWASDPYEAFLLDPWSEMEWQRPNGMTEHEYTGQTLTMLRRWARSKDVALFVVAHPTKLRKDDQGNYPVPTPYDISGSSHWRNKPDVCLTMWRQYFAPDGQACATGEVSLYVMKMRNRLAGKLGSIELAWSSVTGRYYGSELDRSSDEAISRGMAANKPEEF